MFFTVRTLSNLNRDVITPQLELGSVHVLRAPAQPIICGLLMELNDCPFDAVFLGPQQLNRWRVCRLTSLVQARS